MKTQHHPVILTAFALFNTLMMITTANASDPAYRIEYDTPISISCELTNQTTNSKIVMVAIPLSIKFEGSVANLDAVDIEFLSLGQKLKFIDFLPKTTTSTDIAGPIHVETTSQKESTLKARLAGEGIIKDLNSSASAEATKHSLTGTKITFDQLPPRQMLVASGFRNRGYGVFFKLKPSSQNLIEGQHYFICLFEVHPMWRGECIEAKFSPKSSRSWGSNDKKYIIGLHLKNDSEAKLIVEAATPTISKYYSEVLQSVNELHQVRSALLFPYFGLGTKAAEIAKRIAEPKKRYDDVLVKIQNMNSTARSQKGQ